MEGPDQVGFCRVRMIVSVLCFLKYIPEKSYQASDALGKEAGLLIATQRASQLQSPGICAYLLLWDGVVAGGLWLGSPMSSVCGLSQAPTSWWPSPCSWTMASKETQNPFWPEFVVKLSTSLNSN